MINIENNNDNECFKWSVVRFLNPADLHLGRITKSDKEFAKKFDCKDFKLPVKIRDIHKSKKKNSTDISVFGYENKEQHPIYVSKKCCKEKHVDLLLVEEKGKRHYVLIKDFNTFIYNHTLHCRKNIFIVII